MRDLEIGRLVRALRRRRRWRQQDCALRAGVHRSTWSNLERGRIESLSVGVLRRCLAVVGVPLQLALRGDRAEHDRLLDEDHAAIQTRWATRLRSRGWLVWVEHSFSHYGERGRIDLLAWHPATRCLAVIEVKTELADSQDLLGGLDAKVRLAPMLARRLGLPAPAQVVPVILFAESMTTRRRVARLEALFARFDLRGATALRWFGRPTAAGGVLLFTNAGHSRGRGRSPHRVRPSRSETSSAGAQPAARRDQPLP